MFQLKSLGDVQLLSGPLSALATHKDNDTNTETKIHKHKCKDKDTKKTHRHKQKDTDSDKVKIQLWELCSFCLASSQLLEHAA